jgi:LysM repeat protein
MEVQYSMNPRLLKWMMPILLLFFLCLGATTAEARGERQVAVAGQTHTATYHALGVEAEVSSACAPRYVVQPGEWLARIARKCDTSVTAILAANPQISNPNMIAIGQVLDMPGQSQALQLSVVPDRASPGSEIRVIGIGFAADQPVTVGIGLSGSELLQRKEAQADAQGRLDTTITLPEGARPGQLWTVQARYGTNLVNSEPITVLGSGVTATTRANLHLRANPRIGAEIVDVIPAGSMVAVTGKAADGNWLQVNYEGQQGWMAAWYATVSGDLAQVPVPTLFTSSEIYLIALGDGGASGPLLGCNDSAVGVTVTFEPTQAPLTAALTLLLNINESFYGQSGLYNALNPSDLSVQTIEIVDGQATIALGGELVLGGACDGPRVQAQLEQTALQYSTVEAVTILVNGKPLNDVLSAAK